MRKSPEIKERVCVNCGIKYKPQGNTQKYCLKCKSIKEKERKKIGIKEIFRTANPKRNVKNLAAFVAVPFLVTMKVSLIVISII